MARMVVKLHPDRDRCGELTLRDDQDRVICGPFRVSGRASDAPAREHHNDSRDPLLRHGDTPTGMYRVASILRSGGGTLYGAKQYGPYGIIVLDAISGDAALAEANGRYHFFIQGGTTRRGKLRSTNGCLRLFDEDQKTLVAAISGIGITCECLEEAQVGAIGVAFVDNSYNEGDPPPVIGSLEQGPSILGREYSRRNVLIAGAATLSVMALNPTVFIAPGGRGVAPIRIVEDTPIVDAYESPAPSTTEQQESPEQAAPPAAEQPSSEQPGVEVPSAPENQGPGPGSVEAPVSAPGAGGPAAPTIRLPEDWQNPGTAGMGGAVPEAVQPGNSAPVPGQPVNPPSAPASESNPAGGPNSQSTNVPPPGGGPVQPPQESSGTQKESPVGQPVEEYKPNPTLSRPLDQGNAPPPPSGNNPFPSPPPDYQRLKNPLIDYKKNLNPNNDSDVQKGIQKNYSDYLKRQQQQPTENAPTGGAAGSNPFPSPPSSYQRLTNPLSPGPAGSTTPGNKPASGGDSSGSSQ